MDGSTPVHTHAALTGLPGLFLKVKKDEDRKSGGVDKLGKNLGELEGIKGVDMIILFISTCKMLKELIKNQTLKYIN